jgi:hypothetical protein
MNEQIIKNIATVLFFQESFGVSKLFLGIKILEHRERA